MEQREQEAVELVAGPTNYASPEMSVAFVFGVHLGLPMLVIVVLAFVLRRQRRRVREARAREVVAKERSAALEHGDTVIHGSVSSVEPDERKAAIRLVVTQRGVSRKRGKSWQTEWREIDRRLYVSPFRLTTDGGSEILVEPDERVRLVDELDVGPVRDEHMRDLVAELTLGEEVYASGCLTRRSEATAPARYRDAGKIWALTPSADAPMMISTKPLTDRAADRAAGTLLWMMALALFVLVTQGLAVPYHVARTSGQDRVATVQHRAQKHTKDDHYHRVTLALPDGATETIDVESHHDYDNLSVGRTVVTHVSRGWFWTRMTLGAGPRANKFAIYLTVVPLALLLLGCAVSFRRRPAWYEKEELVHEVSGRLP